MRLKHIWVAEVRCLEHCQKKITSTIEILKGHRVQTLGQQIPKQISKSLSQPNAMVKAQYQAVMPDLQGMNLQRYARNISGGNQEFVEATTFQHYLEKHSLLSYEEATKALAAICGSSQRLLSMEDYILGIFDMIGELMRFAITSIATNGGKLKRDLSMDQNKKSESVEEVQLLSQQPEWASGQKWNIMNDLRDLRCHLEAFEVRHNPSFALEVEKKMDVMRSCVEKVENSFYGLVIRGRERSEGWVSGSVKRELFAD
jgi:predicted translin family RNA/ssDNA-binding protein